MTTLIIPARFNGPVASGNGGYSAGLAARLAFPADAGVEATLRAPIPLDTTLRLRERADAADLTTDDAASPILLMSLAAADAPPPAIRPPTWAAAARAAQGYDMTDHVLPTCFVCGPGRAEGDGMRIFTAALDPADNPNALPLAAAPWTPTADFAAPDGRIAPEFIWAALDCPGAFAIDAEPILLGRMTARVIDRPRPGARCVIAAWSAGSERRKHFAGTALFSDAGDLLAWSAQTWISIDQHAHLKG